MTPEDGRHSKAPYGESNTTLTKQHDRHQTSKGDNDKNSYRGTDKNSGRDGENTPNRNRVTHLTFTEKYIHSVH